MAVFNTPVISLDGQSLNAANGAPFIDSNGALWVVSNFAGWYGSPATVTSFQQHPSALGAAYGRSDMGVRVLALDGFFAAEDPFALIAAQNTMSALCANPTGLRPLVVTDAFGVLSCAVQRTGAETLMKPVGDKAVQWSLSVTAPDPRKINPVAVTNATTLATAGTGGVTYPVTYPVDYGPPGANGSVTLTNGGTAEADLLLTISGQQVTAPITIARLDTGDVLTYNASLGPGDQVVIDTRFGTVLYNGVNRRPLLTAPTWLGLPPRKAVPIAFRSGSATDSGLLQVVYHDTYS